MSKLKKIIITQNRKIAIPANHIASIECMKSTDDQDICAIVLERRKSSHGEIEPYFLGYYPEKQCEHELEMLVDFLQHPSRTIYDMP